MAVPLIGSLLALQALFPAVPHQVSLEHWRPKAGDRVVVDTAANEGYLIHTDGLFVRFPVITGQRRGVCYIGRCYNATTPTRAWVIQSQHIKGDRRTFGPSGRFLRLYWDGENTAYGFHEHAAEEIMFARESRFQSMGCIIVRAAMMDILEQTYALNAERGVPVITQYGVEEPVRLAFAEQLLVSGVGQ